MAVLEVKLKTSGMFRDSDRNDDYQLWQEIAEYMDGETAFVLKRRSESGEYEFLALEDVDKDRELHYMMEQDSMCGAYIDDRDRFDNDWDDGKYDPAVCHYLGTENVEVLASIT